MCYTTEELNDIAKKMSPENIAKYLRRLNAEGRLNEFLNDMGIQTHNDVFPVNPKGKILVIGGSNVRRSDLEITINKIGLDKSRFEWVLNYAEAKKYPYRSLQYNENYSAIIVGPVPHKCCYETDCASVLTAIQSEPGYPPVLKLEKGTKLAITKDNFTKALKELKERGIA